MDEKKTTEETLLRLADRCCGDVAADTPAHVYLRENGVTDAAIVAAYRIGSAPEDFKVAGKNIAADGILIPTFDPAALERPVGYIRCWAARNNHRFITLPAGLILPSDIAAQQRIIITDIPLLALRLAQAGAKGVVCAEVHNVLTLYRNWLASKELVVVAGRAQWVGALKQIVTDLGLQGDGVQVHADLPRSCPKALKILGLDKQALNPRVDVPITQLLLRDVWEFAQSRLQEGEGLDALRQLGADDHDFVQAYNLGFLPPRFRQALDASARAALEGKRIENSIIVPAYDDAGNVIDLLAVHCVEKAGGSTHVNVSENLAGMIAPNVSKSFEEIVVVDTFGLAATLFKSGRHNVALFRGIEDLKQNVERLWQSGVRNVDVMFRRSPKEAIAVLEAAGIVAEDCGVPRSHDDISKASLKLGAKDNKEPAKRLRLVTAEPMPDRQTVAPDPAPVAEPVAAAPAPPVVKLELVKHDIQRQQATYKADDFTYTIDIPYDNSAKLALEVRRGDNFHRDDFNLNSEAQRKRFATNGALRTGVPFESIAEHVLHVLDAVRQLQQEAANPARPKSNTVVLTDAERADAAAFLQKPDLLDAIAEDMAALGWAGEDKLKRVLALLLVSRLLEKPVSIALRAPASSGKSHAIEAIAVLAPPEDVVHVSSLSGSALHYQSDLRHKLLIIDEADALTAEVIVALRVLQSRGALTHSSTARDALSGHTIAQFSEARGPVAVLTSTTANLDVEFISRCYDLSVDTSPEQTERILETQRRLTAEPDKIGGAGKRAKIVGLHRNLQRLLRSGVRKVKIPYAGRIRFPSASVRHRREQERFLGLIQSSALLHQFQRLKDVSDGEQYVVADLRDYEIAVNLAADSIGRASDELSVHARDVLSLIQEKKIKSFDINELWALMPSWTHHKLRTGLEELAAMDVITSPKRTRPRRCELQASAAAILSAPHVRLLPATAITVEGIRGSGTFGENDSPVISPTAATG